MPISLITGPANAGKAELALGAVRRHGARAQDPLLVVPTHADVEHYLRELSGEGVAMGVRVERFAGLSAEIAARTGLGEPALDELARGRLLEALARDELGAAGGGLVRALAELISELRVRRVSPARLAGALASWREADGPAAAPSELGVVFSRYDEALRAIGRVDREQRALLALDALRERPALWRGTPVVLYGFDDLTPLQLDTIETLGRVVDAPVTVSLAFEPGRWAFAGRAATFQALAPLAQEHSELAPRADHYETHARTALSHLERSLFEPGAARVESGAAVRLLEGGGERAELELVAEEIASLLERGTPPEEIAVVARPAATSPELLQEVFAAAGIEVAQTRRRRFADAAVGRALISLLRCVPESRDGEAGERGDLLAWLRAPGLLERPWLADSLELRARRGGALSAEAARSLWEERHWRLETIDQLGAARERGPAALIDRAARELYWLFCAPRRSAAALLAADELDEAAALTAGRGALAQLRELAQLAPELAPASASELAGALGGVEIAARERPAPGAVAVLDPLALRARRVRALFVCGLQEGTFPAPAPGQPLLAPEQRRRLAEVAGLVLGDPQERSESRQLAAERYLFYAALSRAQDLLVLSWHSGDDDGQTTPRSLFVDDVCDLFDRGLFARRARRALGAVQAWPAPPAPPRGGERPRAQPHPAAALAQAPLRDAAVLADLQARPWSPSSLERWIGCPVAWLVERLLRPERFEPEPEPLARGALAHDALRSTLEGLRRDTGSARITRATLGRARELLAAALSEGERKRPLSVAPESSATLRRRLQADLERYLEQQAEHESPLEPRELERGFGFAEDDERGEAGDLPALELGAGLMLRGRIDRIDVGASGEAVVYDYKGKDPPGAAKWSGEGKLQVALYMHAAERLLGLRAVGGLYQPLAGTDLRARGVLERDSGVELDCVATDVLDHEQLRELLGDAIDRAREAAGQATRGALEARPDTCAFRGGCMYPAICRCER